MTSTTATTTRLDGSVGDGGAAPLTLSAPVMLIDFSDAQVTRDIQADRRRRLAKLTAWSRALVTLCPRSSPPSLSRTWKISYVRVTRYVPGAILEPPRVLRVCFESRGFYEINLSLRLDGSRRDRIDTSKLVTVATWGRWRRAPFGFDGRSVFS